MAPDQSDETGEYRVFVCGECSDTAFVLGHRYGSDIEVECPECNERLALGFMEPERTDDPDSIEDEFNVERVFVSQGELGA